MAILIKGLLDAIYYSKKDNQIPLLTQKYFNLFS